MPALKVLHVIPSMSSRDGGPARAMAGMERALIAAGVDITTLTTDHDLGLHVGLHDEPDERAPAHAACRIYAHMWLTPYKVAPGLVPWLMRSVGRYDVVHIHALFSFASTVAALAARRHRVPYVVRPLGTLSGYGLRSRRRLKCVSMALVESWILQHAAAVHFTSQAELDEAREAVCLPMHGVVIPLGVDADNCDPAEPLAHEALAGRRVILFLSRLDPKKNLEALIDAVASSAMLRDACALLIAGTGEPGYIASLKARCAAAGLSDRTVWLGHVEGIRKRAAFAVADAFALPSFSENFGLAAIEALLAGAPCVLGHGVAVSREIAAAGAGLAVEPGAGEIARALETMFGDDTRRSRMGAKGAEFARREYSTQAMARRLLALYETVRVCNGR